MKRFSLYACISKMNLGCRHFLLHAPLFYKDISRIYNEIVATEQSVLKIWCDKVDWSRKEQIVNLKLGKRIASLRKANKVTQSELAEYLLVQPQTISRWEAEGVAGYG